MRRGMCTGKSALWEVTLARHDVFIHLPNNLSRHCSCPPRHPVGSADSECVRTLALPCLLSVSEISSPEQLCVSTSNAATFELYLKSALKGQSSLPRHLSPECSKQAVLPPTTSQVDLKTRLTCESHVLRRQRQEDGARLAEP